MYLRQYPTPKWQVLSCLPLPIPTALKHHTDCFTNPGNMAADRVEQGASVALLSATTGHRDKCLWSPDPDTTEIQGQSVALPGTQDSWGLFARRNGKQGR